MKVSKHFTLEEVENGQVSLLDVYEDYVAEYVLHFASRIAEEDHSDVAVLILVASIIEPLGGMMRGGVGSSTDQFCTGFKFIFPSVPGAADIEKTARRVYSMLRSGLYHEGFIKSGLVLLAQGEPICERDGLIRINPKAFLREVSSRSEAYIQGVRQAPEDSSLRKCFNDFWTKMQDTHRMQFAARSVPTLDLQTMPAASTAHPGMCRVIGIGAPEDD